MSDLELGCNLAASPFSCTKENRPSIPQRKAGHSWEQSARVTACQEQCREHASEAEPTQGPTGPGLLPLVTTMLGTTPC